MINYRKGEEKETILDRLAETLRKNGYYVLAPQKWKSSTPACELHVSNFVRGRLEEGYSENRGGWPQGLTRKSFKSGELTISELAADFQNHRDSLESIRRVGPGVMRELEQALKMSGSLQE